MVKTITEPEIESEVSQTPTNKHKSTVHLTFGARHNSK
jgi:hypothetical protein